MTPAPPPPRGTRKDRSGMPSLPGGSSGWPRPIVWGLVTVAVLVVLLSPLLGHASSQELDYSQFREKVAAGQVKSAEISNDSSHITGEFKDGKKFTSTGPTDIPQDDLRRRGRLQRRQAGDP